MWTDKGEIKGTFRTYHATLTKYGCNDEDVLSLQNMWNEPHRVYHNQEHLDEIISLIEHWKVTHPTMTDTEFDLYILAAFFHDAIYDPKSNENELRSAELFAKMCPKASDVKTLDINNGGPLVYSVSDIVYGMILDTKDHTQKPAYKYSEQFLVFDLHGMAFGSLSCMISDEKKIMREFGFVDWDLYHTTRGTKFLEKFAPHIKKAINPNSKVDEYLDWYKNNTPKIAVFAGTFYPFHKGHLDILKRAERIFDKVIVLLCVNPTKISNVKSIPSSLDLTVEDCKQLHGLFGATVEEVHERMVFNNGIEKILFEKALKKRKDYAVYLQTLLPNNQVEFYDGMLHNYIKSKNYPLSIVKGLRNASDFDSEKLQLRYMEDMLPDINIVYIVSDRKYEHVSSSGVNQIQGMGAIDEAKEYLP